MPKYTITAVTSFYHSFVSISSKSKKTKINEAYKMKKHQTVDFVVFWCDTDDIFSKSAHISIEICGEEPCFRAKDIFPKTK